MNVVLAGEESAGLRALDLIGMRDDVRVVLVLSSGRTVAPSLAEVAASRGFRVDPAKRVGSPTLAGELADLGTDLLLNVHSLSIAHADVVAVPRIGSFNLHPGGFRNDLRALGDETPHDERYERAIEFATILRGLLEGDAVSFEGRYYRVTNLRLKPTLPPELRPGLLISGSSRAGRDAARAIDAIGVRYPQPPDQEDEADLRAPPSARTASSHASLRS